MTMPKNSDNKFEPHSDEDLATILEAQLLAMRGLPARSVDAPPAVATSPLVTHPVAESVAAPAAEPMLVRTLAPMPLMFATAEMARLMTPPTVSTTGNVIVDPVVTDEVVAEEVVSEEIVVEEVPVDPVIPEADVRTTVETEAEDVTTEKSPRRAAPVSGNQLQDLPVFVRKSFDDLISGS